MFYDGRRRSSRGNPNELPRNSGARPSLSDPTDVSCARGLGCRVFAWRVRPASPRSVSARTVLSAIRVIHRESREPYGSPSI